MCDFKKNEGSLVGPTVIGLEPRPAFHPAQAKNKDKPRRRRKLNCSGVSLSPFLLPHLTRRQRIPRGPAHSCAPRLPARPNPISQAKNPPPWRARRPCPPPPRSRRLRPAPVSTSTQRGRAAARSPSAPPAFSPR